MPDYQLFIFQKLRVFFRFLPGFAMLPEVNVLS
jgi:hypothetical protein